MSRVGYLPRQRRWPFIVAGALVLLFILFTLSSGFVVNLLWYREVHLSQVFWGVLKTKLLLGFVFGILFFIGLFVNLWIVRKITPDTRVLTPDQEVIEQIRQLADPYLRWLIPIGCALLAIIVGFAASKQWQTFLLWRNSGGVSFGTTEPLFHKDPAFYIFTLPWWKFVQGWVFSTLVGITFLSVLAHVLWGGIRPQAPRFADKVAPQVRAHLSVLLGLIMVAKAVGYWLGRFNLLGSPRGIVQGASYTDVHAQLPALYVLAIAALISAILFFLNARVKLWSLPVISVVLLVLVSIVVGTAIPAFVQQFSVKPQESQREQPYIKDNIAGTRAAFGLDKVNLTPQPVQPLVTAKELDDNVPTVSNIRLWRPKVLEQDFASLQRIRSYYEFNDVDVDRYPVDGQPRVLMIAARELSAKGIPQTGGAWQNEHLAYTHGIGVVASQVNTATAEGQPLFTLQNIPVVGQPTIDQPRIYYGEFRGADGKQQSIPFVITNSGTPEVDFPGATPQDESTFAYDGAGGIPVGNIFQRAMFAWQYKDVNLLISGQIHSDSKILINRDLQTRVQTAAPFLTFDRDPYLSIVDGQLQWIWDAYTTTSQYPYSESISLADATAPNGISGGSVNYIRNSVKVVVDAYNGTMHYYVADPADPIIQVWSRAFPDMFTPIVDASTELQAHFRYPENLFQIQTAQFARYHVTDPTTFFRGTDAWQIPSDPTYCADAANATQAPCDKFNPVGEAPKIAPYYQLLKLPGESSEQFQLVTPFTPAGRPNMVAWMAANSDPEGYGTLTAFQFPSDQTVDGPSTVFAQINADPTFSQERSLLSQGGSKVQFGDFLVIPLGASILYVEPVYVSSDQTNSVPLLKRVIVVNGNTVAVGTTLEDALTRAVTGQPSEPGKPGTPSGTPEARIAALLADAVQHFQAAQDALKAGDLGTYQTELKLAQDLVQQANDLAQKLDTSSSGSSPSPVPPVTTSATPSP